MEGAAFLSARTGAGAVVPIGIGASDLAMYQGADHPQPLKVQVVIGPALPPPGADWAAVESHCSSVHAETEELVVQAADGLRRGEGQDGPAAGSRSADVGRVLVSRHRA